MLKTVSISSNRKLGGCAVTYRSGSTSVYSTCPNECPLKPAGTSGSSQLDEEYLRAVIDAVPIGGLSWTYSHFKNLAQLPKPSRGKTVINVSADNIAEAIEFLEQGFPTVLSTPASFDAKVDTVESNKGCTVRIVRCPAEYNDKVNCRNCGSGQPLCARGDRDYIIKFTAHGSTAKKVGSEELGGCYGTGGPVAIHWKKTMTSTQEVSDSEKLTEWIKTLPYGTLLRHHIVGDVGMQI